MMLPLIDIILLSLDIEECANGLHGCDHHCHNNHGSYTCSCRIGYRLQGDGRSCEGKLATRLLLYIRMLIYCITFCISLQCILQKKFSFIKSIHVGVCIILSTQKQPGCKKRCSLVQNSQCEKSCEIKGGDQEMAVTI